MGAVRSLTQQYEARFANKFEQRIVILVRSRQGMSGIANQVRNNGQSGIQHLLHLHGSLKCT